ncbi:MAG: 30S ribosomal protein S1 [Armatimonadota bacterium]|nr:30S ribosomal protein S1 [Armatimonadota bacterium]
MESDEFSSYLSGADTLARGALLKGVVVRRDESSGEVLVDIGTKSEGIISKNEVGDEDINVGDEIEVVVLRSEDDEGHPVLSKRRADYERTWREIQEAKEKGTFVEGTVREQVKGGLIVDLGVPAFVPASHVDVRNRGDLSRYVGRTIPVRVIEIDRKKNKVIASHRLAAEEERRHRKEQTWANLQKDKIVEGTVRRITDFGAFIDLGGVDGLLHVREMSWGRVEHPEQVVKKGQKLQVLILDIDEERERIALGLKQLLSDPWKKAAKNYRPAQMVTGKVVRLAPTCAFVELEEGVEGIIPVSEISEQRIKAPDEVLQVGQQVEARVKQIQPNQRRITLSMKSAVQERERRETRSTLREISERSDDSVRLGDVFGQQLRAARDRGKERNATRQAARERALQAAEEEEDDTGGWAEENTPANTISASAPTDDGEDAVNAAGEPAVEEQEPAPQPESPGRSDDESTV